MAEWWMITGGYLTSLALLGGLFMYALLSSLDIKDSVRIDPLPDEKAE